jgi:hypothetical protein
MAEGRDESEALLFAGMNFRVLSCKAQVGGNLTAATEKRAMMIRLIRDHGGKALSKNDSTKSAGGYTILLPNAHSVPSTVEVGGQVVPSCSAQLCERSSLPQDVFDGQWVFDCVDARERLSLKNYRAELAPPPDVQGESTPGKRKR